MNLAFVITSRAADAPADPDTLHGLLNLIERGCPEARLVALVGGNSIAVRRRIEDARKGSVGRVPPVNSGTGYRDPGLPGLFPRLWQRDVIALMLRPDGATTEEIDDLVMERGRQAGAGSLVSDLRRDLRDFHIAIEAKRTGDGFQHRYRIVGNDAWRMQRIIANGWSL